MNDTEELEALRTDAALWRHFEKKVESEGVYLTQSDGQEFHLKIEKGRAREGVMKSLREEA